MKKPKDQSRQVATKGDLKKLETRFDGLETRFDGLETRFDGLETNVHTLMSLYVSIDGRVKNIEENMYTKKDHEKFMIFIDETVTELRDAREGRVLSEAQIMRLDDQMVNHEKRLVVLENK